MKTQTIRSMLLVLIFIMFTSCKNEVNPELPDDGKQIQFIASELGGCNDKYGEGEIDSETDFQDTVIYSMEAGKLFIEVGINYICCTPFVTNCQIQNDSILIFIEDVCNDPYKSCYCRCNCYYTFKYSFDNVLKSKYTYKIVLSDPREDKEKVFREGSIVLTK